MDKKAAIFAFNSHPSIARYIDAGYQYQFLAFWPCSCQCLGTKNYKEWRFVPNRKI